MLASGSTYKWFSFASAFFLLFSYLGAMADDVAGKQEVVTHETYKVLSTHHTEAVFKGIENRPCRFRTSLCPDRCNHGGKVAVFTIVRYIEYKKPGQYGDPKTKEFSIMLKAPDMPQTMIGKIEKLTPGVRVKLNWEHRYITRTSPGGGVAKFPRRVITKLEKSKSGTPTDK